MIPLYQTANIIETALNRFGAQQQVSTQTLPCKFREITDVNSLPNQENIGSDAMAWFEPAAPIERGTILQIDGEYYRVDRLTKARKLHSNNVEFIKCLLEKHGEVITQEVQS